MKLFRRVLLSLFPQEMIDQQMNPASMFVSFISPKQFFSVINRKIVENYKLNLFDICLDPFEVKIGFGDHPTLNVKDVDAYYAYNATANLNGWNFYTPGNVGTAISLVMAVLTKKIFKKIPYYYFTQFVVSIYLLTFVFAARIKVFPHTDKEKNYSWFIELFFAFYELTIQQSGKSVDKKLLKNIKKNLLQHIQLFFMLFYFYKRIGNYFSHPHVSGKEFYQWLFYDHSKKGSMSAAIHDFINHAHMYTKVAAFSTQDKEIIESILPADVLVRYLLQGRDSLLIVDKLVSHVYDKDKLQPYIHSFLKDDSQFESFIQYIMDRTLFKRKYFKGIKKLTMHKFKLNTDYQVEQEIDSFISSLEEQESLDGVKVPEKLKKESAMMDRLVNFYVTYLGGLWVGRGDTFSLRLFRKDMLHALMKESNTNALRQDALYFYGGLLYNYSKNIFYYKYAYNNIKAGKENFSLPLKPSSKEVYSNMFILKLFDEHFLTTLLQDSNKKNLKIYVVRKKVISLFKQKFAQRISFFVTYDKTELLRSLYGNVYFFMQAIPDFFTILEAHLTDQDIATIKENVYCLDVRLWVDAVKLLVDTESDLSKTYGDMSIVGIMALLRETLVGFLLRYQYMSQSAVDADVDLYIAHMKKIYVVDVLNISEYYVDEFTQILEALYTEYHVLLQEWVELDDNKKYFSLGVGNRLAFIENKSGQQVVNEVMGEDVIWFRGYLKTITYYNKRYVIPK